MVGNMVGLAKGPSMQFGNAETVGATRPIWQRGASMRPGFLHSTVRTIILFYVAALATACDARLESGADVGEDAHVATDVGMTDAFARDSGADAAPSCGSCDDAVDCTADRCVTGACAHPIEWGVCAAGTYCDAARGCVGSAVCSSVADCPVSDPCVVPSCNTSMAMCAYAPLDGDADGALPIACGGDDCDDADPDINTGGTESCNGADDDCNGMVDDGSLCSNGYVCNGTCTCEHQVCDDAGTLHCFDTDTDPLHCGSCGHACDADATCVAGRCVCDPSAPTTCGNDCVDLMTDPANCGSCDHRCDAGMGMCAGGMCACSAGESLCAVGTNQICADLMTDPQNCGTCGHHGLVRSTCAAGSPSADAVWLVGYGTHTAPMTITEVDVGPTGDVFVESTGPAQVIGGSTTLFGATPTTFGIARVLGDGTFAGGLTLHGHSFAVAGTDGGYVLASVSNEMASGNYSLAGMTLACTAPAGRTCSLLAGVSSTHALRWSRVFASTAAITAPNFVDLEHSGANVVAAGSVDDFDFGGGVLGGSAAGRGFVATFDEATGAYVSGFRVPGAIGAMEVAPNGTVVIGAAYSGTPTVGGTVLPSSTGAAPRYYVARFDASGAASGVTTFAGGSALLAVSDTRIAVATGSMVSIVDGTGATVGSFGGAPTMSGWDGGLAWVGAGPVLVGGSSVAYSVNGTPFAANRSYTAVLDGAAAFQAVYELGANTGAQMVVSPYDADELVIATTGFRADAGSLLLQAGGSRYGTFIMRVRVR